MQLASSLRNTGGGGGGGGCKHGCGTTKNQEWGKKNGKTGTKPKPGKYVPPPQRKPKNPCGWFASFCNAAQATAGIMGRGLSSGLEWIKDNRGMLATILATAGCFVPALGMALCAVMQAAAFAVRTEQTISEKGGWEVNKERILVDGVLTAGTLGVGSAFRMAQFGKVGPVKDVPLVPLPKLVSPANKAAYDAVSVPGWVQATNMKMPLGMAPQLAQFAAWTGPSLGINRCYVQQAC